MHSCVGSPPVGLQIQDCVGKEALFDIWKGIMTAPKFPRKYDSPNLLYRLSNSVNQTTIHSMEVGGTKFALAVQRERISVAYLHHYIREDL